MTIKIVLLLVNILFFVVACILQGRIEKLQMRNRQLKLENRKLEFQIRNLRKN